MCREVELVSIEDIFSGSGLVFGRRSIILPYSMLPSVGDRLYWCHSGHQRAVESALFLSCGCLRKNVM